ncbi:unnamed protein product [Bursaphelenchus okinawaensis]|uniref:Uncharacterized protein n=1 Tax=Bursaphelenchus okinawaensis TaxID=465554 RepID=A0A811K6F9_9BILA|nr:unnamed protein product [Bursaphelenchus okinawaensis]CAG9093171.1 unnamed protein product [Bursaphelenchus okinawaensis]
MNPKRHQMYNLRDLFQWSSDYWSRLRSTVKAHLHIEPYSFVGLVIFGAFLLCILTCMPLACCCNRKSKGNQRRLTTSRSKQTVNNVRDDDVKTPLFRETSADALKKLQTPQPDRLSRELLLKKHNIRTADESPPPPRRSNGGRTLIVPLNGSSYRLNRGQTAPLLGTPDSRVTSFEAGTTKSCATIPEDDELELDDEITVYNNIKTHEVTDDLISIDRTYISRRDCRSIVNRPHYTSLIDPIPQPMYKFNPPSYTPPEPPRPDTVTSTPARRSNITSHHITTFGQSNLSSPDASSLGLGSLMETTGSGSYAITMESEDRARVYYDKGEKNFISELDESSVDINFRNVVLHRIEEEESNFEDPSSIGRFLGSPSGSGLSNKYHMPLIGSMHRIPRSISQQLELMNGSRLNS